MGFKVDEAQVADFGGYLGAEASQTLPDIEKLAREEGMSDDGFTGLLSPLGDIVKGEGAEMVGQAFNVMQDLMCNLGDGVIGAAKSYGYVDAENSSMLERFSIDGDDPGVTYGTTEKRYNPPTEEDMNSGKAEASDYSDFQVTELTKEDIERPDTDFSEDLDVGTVLSVLDWIWSEFEVDGGKGFTDSIISPLSGNYNSITANGEAWTQVGTQFGELVGNMGTNTTTLVDNSWEGDASAALKEFVDVSWTRGAAWAGEKIGTFIGLGFEKIAEASKKIAQAAIDLIKKVAKIARKIATKFIPVVGWAWTAIEYLGKAIGIDVDALHNDIMNIIALAKLIYNLQENLTTIVETMDAYFATADELLTTVKSIPEIGSLEDAVAAGETIKEKGAELGEQKTQLKEATDGAKKDLKEIDKVLEELKTE